MNDRRAVVAWTLGAIFFFFGFVLRVSPSVMVDELMRDFAVGAAVLGNMSAFYFYAYAVLQIPIGMMMDSFGPRRLLSGAALICALGCLLFATADHLWLAYLGRTLIGGGAAFAFVGTLSISAQNFPIARFALLTGLLQLFGMIGAIGGQSPTALMVSVYGWRTALILFSVCIALLALLLWCVVRDQQTSSRAGNRLDGLKHVLRNRQTWICAAIGLSMASTLLAFGGLWGVSFLTSVYAIDKVAAASILSLFFVGWGVTSPVVGWASDKIKRRNPFFTAGTCILALLLSYIIRGPDISMTTMAILLFLCGGAGSTMILTYASVKELNDARASGAAIGVVNMSVVGSGALMQPVIGYMLDVFWDGQLSDGVRMYSQTAFESALWVLPIIAAIGFVLSLLLTESHGIQHGSTESNAGSKVVK